MGSVRTASLFFLTLASACMKYLPAPASPEKIVPKVELVPLEPGSGRVLFEVVDCPARVDEITAKFSTNTGAIAVASTGAVAVGSSSSSGENTKFICITPCAASLPIGHHEFRFTPTTTGPKGDLQASTVTLQVKAGTAAFRHVLPRYRLRCPSAYFAGAILTPLIFTMPFTIPMMVSCGPESTPGASTEWVVKDEHGLEDGKTAGALSDSQKGRRRSLRP